MFSEEESIIKNCIYNSLNKQNGTIFDSLCDLFEAHFEKPVNNMLQLKKRNTKSKGFLFEVFCTLYLKEKNYEVWLLKDTPSEILSYLNVPSFDVGIDLIARIKKKNQTSDTITDYFYFAVQCKYRKPTKDMQGRTVHRVTWKDVSTFVSLCSRTGPWLKHIIMTNAQNVSWRGKKSNKDWTIAKKSFEKCNKFFWMKLANIKKKVEIEEDVIINFGESKSLSNNELVRNNRQKWLDSLYSK